MASSKEKWAALTWGDLSAWAGSRSVERGRAYQRAGKVKDLGVTEEGKLLATVKGGEKYVTAVWMTGEADLKSACTCPVGVACKHAVAVVAEYLEEVAVDTEVPTVGKDDKRWKKLEVMEEGEAGNEDDVWEDDEDDEEEEAPPRRAEKKAKGHNKKEEWGPRIRKHIEAKSKEELVELVWGLTKRFPELHDEFRERLLLGEGDVDKLVTEARKELRRVTSEAGWRNNWTGEGSIPDFSKLKHRLERMAELGHADAVVKLGREVMSRGMNLVGQSHDEGETVTEVASCMPVILGAVERSSLTPSEKLLFVIDLYLKDEFNVIGDAGEGVMAKEYGKGDWSLVADEMEKRLKAKTAHGDEKWHDNYIRDQISGWLAEALEKSGREKELLPLYEREARATQSYQRLVAFLIEKQQYGAAEQWAKEGIEKTIQTLPGIAAALGKLLAELAERREQWDVVAAYAAMVFFEGPSIKSFESLMAAATKAGCEEKVRAAAMRYLETGVAPIKAGTGKKDAGKVTRDPDWPLPMPEYLAPLMRFINRGGPVSPHYGVLIEMAIKEKRNDDALAWYEKSRGDKNRQQRMWYGGARYGDEVAKAVSGTHPERALEIYRRRVDGLLGEASKSAYQAVADYLRKMRPIYAGLAREREWKQVVEDLQIRYRNRPRFMEILETLEGKSIIETHRELR